MLNRRGTKGLCILLVTLASAALPAAAQEDPDFQGHWEGSVLFPGEELEIDVDLVQRDDGVWSGDITIPAQQTEDVPLTEVMVAGTVVSFKMGGVPGEPAFRGTISEDQRTISGTFTQGPAEFQFRLRRMEGS